MNRNGVLQFTFRPARRSMTTSKERLAMPVTKDQPAPYAPPSAIMGLIERHRNKGLPSPVDADVLARAGISDSLIPRTLQALNSLDLLTEDGKPSDVLEGLRLAAESEYTGRLVVWLKSAYADALNFVDPATEDEIRIRDAFRSYKPTGQQSRMVTLFIGLFTSAGVIPERLRPITRQTRQSQAPKARAKTNLASKIADTPRQVEPYAGNIGMPLGISSSLPPAIAGLLASLPKVGTGWTKERRDAFHMTFGSVMDFCFPIVEQNDIDENGD
jgi:Family of unknown function (DUF5343)